MLASGTVFFFYLLLTLLRLSTNKYISIWLTMIPCCLTATQEGLSENGRHFANWTVALWIADHQVLWSRPVRCAYPIQLIYSCIVSGSRKTQYSTSLWYQTGEKPFSEPEPNLTIYQFTSNYGPRTILTPVRTPLIPSRVFLQTAEHGDAADGQTCRHNGNRRPKSFQPVRGLYAF